jgi:hypothetical protein
LKINCGLNLKDDAGLEDSFAGAAEAGFCSPGCVLQNESLLAGSSSASTAGVL